MQWTNLLYKAEGVCMHSEEHLLQEAPKHKGTWCAQRQRRWEKRTAPMLEKMQRQQDRWQQNLC